MRRAAPEGRAGLLGAAGRRAYRLDELRSFVDDTEDPLDDPDDAEGETWTMSW